MSLHTLKRFFLCLGLLFIVSLNTYAQIDSTKRTPKQIVTDGFIKSFLSPEQKLAYDRDTTVAKTYRNKVSAAFNAGMDMFNMFADPEMQALLNDTADINICPNFYVKTEYPFANDIFKHWIEYTYNDHSIGIAVEYDIKLKKIQIRLDQCGASFAPLRPQLDNVIAKANVELAKLNLTSVNTSSAAILQMIKNLIREIKGIFVAGANTGMVRNGAIVPDFIIRGNVASPSDIVAVLPYTLPQKITVTPVSKTKEYFTANKLPVTLQDAGGKLFLMDENRVVTLLGRKIALNMSADELNNIRTDKATVTFSAASGFDSNPVVIDKSNEFKRHYLNHNGYRVPCKLTQPDIKTSFSVQVAFKDNTLKKDSLRFVTGKSLAYPASYDGTKFTVEVIGAAADDAQELYVLYPMGGGIYMSLGKILLPSYEPLRKKLTLVPVGTATISQSDVQTALNGIYNPYGISWDVSVANAFTNTDWDANANGLDVKGSGALSRLTTEMRALNNAYKAANANLEAETVYMFVLTAASDSTVKGDMPRGKQFGYVFTQGNNNVAVTIAHELAHGSFKLRHTFDNYGFSASDLSSNLLNYNTGTELCKAQWDFLYDPAVTGGLFDSDEDGEWEGVDVMIDPTGYPINMGNTNEFIFYVDYENLNRTYPIGSIYGFAKKTSPSVIYRADINDGEFFGYKNSNGNFFTPEKLNVKTGTTIKVFIWESFDITGKCEHKYYIADYVVPEKTTYVTPSLGLSKLVKHKEGIAVNENCKDGFSKSGINGSGSGGSIIDYSQGADGVSILLKSEITSFTTSTAGLNSKFGINTKTYLLSKQNPQFSTLFAEANSDPSPNKVIIIIDGTKSNHTINLQHKFAIPSWMKLSGMQFNNDGCEVAYVNTALTALHNTSLYKSANLLDQISSEYSVAIYRSIFGFMYCATDENSVSSSNNATKFLAGATHELIASIDLADMVSGLLEMAKGVTNAKIEAETSYILDLKRTFENIASGTSIPPLELATRLLPPSARLANEGAQKASAVATHFVRFYFTDCESIEQFGSSMCPYRYGQVTVMVVPIVLTAGEWAFIKSGQMLLRLKAFKNLSKTDDVAVALAKAENASVTIVDDVDKITIKNGEEITTIEKNGDDVVIETETVSTSFIEGITDGVRRYNIQGEIAKGSKSITRKITVNGRSINLKWTVNADGFIDFGNRSDLAILLGTVDDEAHHILTWTESGSNSVVQSAAKDGFHLNTFENGIGLSKYKKSLNEGLHGNHPQYDKFVVHKLKEFERDFPNYSPQAANEYIQKNIIPLMRDLIEDASKSDMNLNEYFKQVVNPSVGILLK